MLCAGNLRVHVVPEHVPPHATCTGKNIVDLHVDLDSTTCTIPDLDLYLYKLRSDDDERAEI